MPFLIIVFDTIDLNLLIDPNPNKDALFLLQGDAKYADMTKAFPTPLHFLENKFGTESNEAKKKRKIGLECETKSFYAVKFKPTKYKWIN